VSGRTTVITHPAVIRAALVTTLHTAHTTFWRIDIPPLTATTLSRRGGRWTLQHTNATM